MLCRNFICLTELIEEISNHSVTLTNAMQALYVILLIWLNLIFVVQYKVYYCTIIYFIFSVNKNNDNFEYNEDPNEFYGHKWTLKTFWKYLEMEGHDTKRIWRRIKNVMIKTVMCGYPDIVQGDNIKYVIPWVYLELSTFSV